MSTSIHTNVSVFRHGRLQQGYSLEGDKTKVVLRSRGFSIVVKMQDKEDRPQASVKVCGHTVFDTEDHVLKAPEIVATPFGKLENFVSPAVLKEARASVTPDSQTQSAQEEEG